MCPISEAVGGVITTVNTLSILTPWMAVLGIVGCISTVVLVAKKRQSQVTDGGKWIRLVLVGPLAAS